MSRPDSPRLHGRPLHVAHPRVCHHDRVQQTCTYKTQIFTTDFTSRSNIFTTDLTTRTDTYYRIYYTYLIPQGFMAGPCTSRIHVYVIMVSSKIHVNQKNIHLLHILIHGLVYLQRILLRELIKRSLVRVVKCAIT